MYPCSAFLFKLYSTYNRSSSMNSQEVHIRFNTALDGAFDACLIIRRMEKVALMQSRTQTWRKPEMPLTHP